MLLALVHCPQTLDRLYMVITTSVAPTLPPPHQVNCMFEIDSCCNNLFLFVVLPATPISQFPAYPRSSSSAAAVPQPSPTTPTPTQPAAAPVKLQLNKQQLAVAHKMFEEAPTLTREQKALILGFMAGSRGTNRYIFGCIILFFLCR